MYSEEISFKAHFEFELNFLRGNPAEESADMSSLPDFIALFDALCSSRDQGN